MSKRIDKCLSAGGTMELFPVLADWPKEELEALVRECDEEGCAAQERLNSSYGIEALKAENFLSPRRARQLDEAFKKASIEVVATYSEIASVALFYLDRADSTCE